MDKKITMAHGSGGKSSAELMKQIFGKYFHNEILDRLEDAAVLDLKGGRFAYSTDSFVVNPIEFKGGNIGKLSVCGTVNDLLMMGAEPLYLSSGFILEEGLDTAVLDRIAKALSEEAEKAGVQVVTGDTKVIEGRGGLMINTSGIGYILPERDVRAANCRPGDAILLSGTLGDHHACILSARMGIENSIVSDCGVLKEITDALFGAEIPVHTMRDVTRGGLGTVLNELAESADVGIRIKETSLPVNPEVRGFCDILGLDPLYMGNEGKMVAVVPGERAEEALALMRGTEMGKNAAIIGFCTSDSRGVILETPLGGTRVVDMLYGEGLPRIC